MGFQILDMLFNSCLPCRLAGRRWQDDYLVKTLQILIGAIKDQFIFCMFGNSGTEVIWYKVFGKGTIVFQCMYRSGYEVCEFLIFKSFRIDQAADTYRCNKKWTFWASPVILSTRSLGWSPTQSM